ncbi:MAG: (2Fe-2S)-binding protein [Actinobacteria bacterium]|nr:(2Fe-2S)-binding protein [Actinomycetota bacterium]
MRRPIELSVNGVTEEVYVEPWWTLARVLRDELGLTGTKVSCETGDCGACTVNIDGRAVRSCIYPVMKAVGKKIVTIEGLSGEDDSLHPLQQAFLDHFAVQCGYCTPGMVMSANALLQENPHPTEAEIKEGLKGNLCRCTGYNKIIQAVAAAASASAPNKEN